MKKTCTACALHEASYRNNCIPGEGSETPTWLFIGEAPGETEDEMGVPFCGRTGVEFRAVLFETLNFPEDECRFTNAVRCWPGPGNPKPTAGQLKTCKKHLLQEIDQYNPKVIVILGAIALQSVLGREQSITRSRGTAWEGEDGRLYIATFHPTYVQFYAHSEETLEAFRSDLKTAKELGISGMPSTEENEWWVIDSFDESMDLISTLEQEETSISFDIETHGEIYDDDRRWLSSAYCIEPGWAFCIPLQKSDGPFSDEQALKLMVRIGQMHEYRRRHDLKMEAYSAVMEIKFPASFGIPPPDLDFDPYLAHHLLNEEMVKPSLKQLAWIYTDIGGYDAELDRYKREHPEADPEKGGSYDNIPLSILGPYNAADADCSKRLRLIFEPQLKAEKLDELLRRVTLPASYVMAEYESNGLYIDEPVLRSLEVQYPTRMSELTQRIRRLKDVKTYEIKKAEQLKVEAEKQYQIKIQRYKHRLSTGQRVGAMPRQPKEAEFKFKPGSRKHIIELLYDEIGLPIVARSKKTNEPSFNKVAKAVLADEHPIVPLLSDFASLRKFFGTYIKEYSKGRDPNGIYHGYYNLAGTVTGRLSSNLQQLPRAGTNADVRRMLTSRFGDRGLMAEIDVSQGELRMMCLASKDKALTRIFKSGEDAHTMAAVWVYEVRPEEVHAEMRARIKSGVSFGLIYGRSADGLARDFGWSVERAQEFIDRYFELFSGVRRKINWYHSYAEKHGYVVNLLGRKRRLPLINSTNFALREHAKRQAVNSPIQSTLHDLMLVAEIKMLDEFNRLGLESKLCGEAHDSVIMDVLYDEAPEAFSTAKRCLETLDEEFKWINIPIVADLKVGPNLCDLEELKDVI